MIKKLECVTVSVGYGDFLAHSLPRNKNFFDNMVVVTSLDDELTYDICTYYHVKCIKTDRFYSQGDIFCKGEGINAGLKELSLDDWVLHMDADIVLPPRFREILHKIDLDPKNIYGTDRIEVQSYDEWLEFIEHPEIQHSQQIFVQSNAFPMGVRIAQLDKEGYVPIGFLQLWNPKSSGVFEYPICNEGAERADMNFALKWPRRNRVLIPEIIAIHLQSETSEMGANWRGRKTRPFRHHKHHKPYDRPLPEPDSYPEPPIMQPSLPEYDCIQQEPLEPFDCISQGTRIGEFEGIK